MPPVLQVLPDLVRWDPNPVMTSNNLIFDVGLHTGQDTAFYLKKGFRVIAIEANPLLAQQAKARFADACTSGRLRVLNLGVGAETGRFPFYVNTRHTEWSSFDCEFGSRDCTPEIIDVEMVRLEDIVAEHGVPYYIKIEIEGHDMIALRSIARFPELPRYVSAENGEPEMLDLMCRLGYGRFKFINQAYVPAMRCPSPALEGLDVLHEFEYGSSGPFGRETVGEWKSRDEVLAEILAYWNEPTRDPNIYGWYDLHAQVLDRATHEPRIVRSQHKASRPIDRSQNQGRVFVTSGVPKHSLSTHATDLPTETYVSHVGWLRHGPGDEVAELLRQGRFEADEQAFLWLYLRSGSVFIDGGAHVGLFAVLAGQIIKKGGRVIAVEPDPSSAKMLRANLRDNAVRNAKVIEAALWDRTGQVNLSSPPVGKSAFATIAGSDANLGGRVVASITPTDLLDDCGIASADVVKLDLEGAEPRVVAAAKHLALAGRLPLLIVEFTEDNLRRNKSSSDRLHAELSDMGYTVCEFDAASLRLRAYEHVSPIWHKNLFAVRDLDQANAQLASADGKTTRIARDILYRASSASKLNELEELETWKLRAREAENYRVWAERTEALLEQQKDLSEQLRRWAENAQRDVDVARAIAEQNRGWAERMEVLLVNEKALTSQYRDWIEGVQQELRKAHALARDNQGWAEHTEGLLVVERALADQLRQWAEGAQHDLDAARAAVGENQNWAERTEVLLAAEKALSGQYRDWAKAAQRDLEAVRAVASENQKWAERTELLLAAEKALSGQYRDWAEGVQRDLDAARSAVDENQNWAERTELLLAAEKALSGQYRDWAQGAQRDLEAARAVASENQNWAERTEVLLAAEITLSAEFRKWAEGAQHELEGARKLVNDNQRWAERTEILLAAEKGLAGQYRNWAEAAQRELDAARGLARANRDWAERIEGLLVSEKTLSNQYRKWAENGQQQIEAAQALARDNQGWAERAESLLISEKALSNQYREWAEKTQSELEQTRHDLAVSRAKIINLRALVTLFRPQRFRSILKRIVTGGVKPR